MSQAHLTDEAFWDDYWGSMQLPLEVDPSRSVLASEIATFFERFLPPEPRRSVLEVGGAPGQYAAFVARLGHAVTIFDSSPIGCLKARENFELLGLQADVVEGDMFEPPPDLPRLDAVFSLGLIEHFEDVTGAVRAHVRLTAPGGLLLLGVPNLAGINGRLLRRLSPEFLSKHHIRATDLETWDRFERELGLQRLFRGHIAGFDPSMFWRCESPRFVDRALAELLRRTWGLAEWKRARALRRVNGAGWSAYLVGAYRVP